MDFGTFLLYFIGAVVILVVGWYMFWFALAIFGGTLIAASDGLKEGKNRRASAKWERVEENLEDEEEGPSS